MDIVSGLMLFNQVILKEKSIRLAVDNHKFKISDPVYKHFDFERLEFLFSEIGRDSFFQVFRFSYIYDFPVLIEKLVHSRLIG